jgi:hypothetical protein
VLATTSLCLILGHSAATEDTDDEQRALFRAAVREAAEIALYNQNALLDRALANVLQGNPQRIEYYFVGIGGDGHQDVFRKEVEYAHRLFDERFDTRDRSVLLLNNLTTVQRYPLATITAIEHALRAVAARMDPAQDILVVFVTSHGTEDHELELTQPGLSLADLSAARLGEMLHDLPVKWKVVILSACFSGGFIPALEDPYTLIITAARADRSSFGCNDDAELTYFGRALLQEALPQSASFVDAFEKAARLIDEWERSDEFDDPHSLPQLVAPPAFRKHAERWRSCRATASC